MLKTMASLAMYWGLWDWLDGVCFLVTSVVDGTYSLLQPTKKWDGFAVCRARRCLFLCCTQNWLRKGNGVSFCPIFLFFFFLVYSFYPQNQRFDILSIQICLQDDFFPLNSQLKVIFILCSVLLVSLTMSHRFPSNRWIAFWSCSFFYISFFFFFWNCMLATSSRQNPLVPRYFANYDEKTCL